MDIRASPSDEPLTPQSSPSQKQQLQLLQQQQQHHDHHHFHAGDNDDAAALPSMIVLRVRPKDVGYQIVGDFSRDPVKPSFRMGTTVCFCGGHGPPKPKPILSNMSDETWENFCQDTIDIINTRMRASLILYGTFLFLYKLPVWIIPALRHNNNNNQSDSSLSGGDDDDDDDDDANYTTEEEQQHQQPNETAHFWYSLYIGFLMFDLVLALVVIWPSGRRAHKEIQEVRDKYAFDFYNAGIHLLYIRDRNAAYWVFRPLSEDEENYDTSTVAS